MITTQIPVRAPAEPAPANGAGPGGGAAPRAPRRRVLRRIAWVAALLAVAAVSMCALRPTPVEVETEAVRRGPLRVTVDEDGVTRVREPFSVAAPVAGRLLRLALEEGDAVAAGQVVARIAAAPRDGRDRALAAEEAAAAEAAAREAGAAVEARRAELAQARHDADRLRALEEAGAVSPQRAEQAATEAEVRARALAAALARARAADAQARAARRARADDDPDRAPGGTVTLVRAPAAGRVLRLTQRSETPVAAGTPLVELGDAGALEVRVDVLSTDAVRIRPGMAVLVEEWGGEETLPARVRTVSPAAVTRVSALGVEEQRVDVVADLLRPAPGLGAGFRVETRIVTWEAAEALRVPVSALFRVGAGWGVFVVEGGRARHRAVAIGHRGEDAAEVRGGLSAGDVVVVHPSDRVADGVRVRAR